MKKLTDALNTAKENLAATESQQSKLQDEVSIVQERQSSVRCEFQALDVVLIVSRQLEAHAEEAGRRLREKRTELEHIQRDTSRIRLVGVRLPDMLLLMPLPAAVSKRKRMNVCKKR